LSPLITQQTGRPGLKRRELEAILARNFDVIHFHNISLVGGPRGALDGPGQDETLFVARATGCSVQLTSSGRIARRAPVIARRAFSCCLRSGIPPQVWRLGGLIGRELETSRSAVRAERVSPRGKAPRCGDLATDRSTAAVLADRRRARAKPCAAICPPAVFLFVGRVYGAEGHPARWSRAFVRLPEYDLDVAGDGELRLPARSASSRSARNIRFLGAVTAAELPALYATARATIVPLARA